jgi:LPS export ABC transporter permease LptG/LPS export ABC transporter permease LptF
MRLLSRTIFREVFASALLGCVLFTLVLFLEFAKPLFEFLVRSSGPARQVAYLFALVIPQALPFAIPLGVLVGTLIALSRMSADGEITAMRAAGIPGRRVLPPIAVFGVLTMLVTAAASLWLAPWSIRERYRVLNQLIASELTADVQPRTFNEDNFPNTIVYIGDVKEVVPGSLSRWRNIFLADVTPPENRAPSASQQGDSPKVTLAIDALALADVRNNRIQLRLQNATDYIAGKEAKDFTVLGNASGDRALQAKQEERQASRPAIEMDTRPLYRAAYHPSPDNPALTGGAESDKRQILDARIELHQRFALPLACLLLAFSGIPLGVTARRTSKSGAVVMTVAIAFAYYLGLIGLISIAGQGKLAPGIAVWIPNEVFSLFGLVMLVRLESPGDRDILGRIAAFFRSFRRVPAALAGAISNDPRRRGRVAIRSLHFPLLAQIVDTYILSAFLFYFVLCLASFVVMYHTFEFFRLLSDIIKNNVPISHVLQYHLFLTPRLIYSLTPVAVLAAVLVVFGVLAKHNEITAFKASGISAYRMAAPVLVAGVVLSGGLFAFDHYWVPEFDRRQEQIYNNEIKGRPAQTYLQADRKWIYGLQDRIYYYKYFDTTQKVMGDVNVYEIDPQRFLLKRQISAQRARWEPVLKQWVFENGWSNDIDGRRVHKFDPFPGATRTFPELVETPEYFLKEVKDSPQMNFLELRAYIEELKQAGFETTSYQVQFHKKFSQPLFALILALVSIPFAFLAGNRGAMTGVGISFAIFLLYWSADQLSVQIGNLGQLSAAVAAWSPDVVFSLAGLYFLARMRT